MRRREFIGLLGGATAWPLAVRAQQQTRIARIGYLGFGAAAGYAPRVEALRTGLRDLGYVEGKNIVIADRLLSITDNALGNRDMFGLYWAIWTGGALGNMDISIERH